jgi:hypothetical protein
MGSFDDEGGGHDPGGGGLDSGRGEGGLDTDSGGTDIDRGDRDKGTNVPGGMFGAIFGTPLGIPPSLGFRLGSMAFNKFDINPTGPGASSTEGGRNDGFNQLFGTSALTPLPGGGFGGDFSGIQQGAFGQGIEQINQGIGSGIDRLESALGPAIEAQQPFRDIGLQAQQQQSALLGLSGPEAQQQAFSAFQESPGQKFLREQGERAILRRQAALKNLSGGDTLAALQERGIGLAAQQQGTFLDRLSQLSGRGQQAATNIGQFGLGSAGNIANLEASRAGSIAELLGAQGAAAAAGDIAKQQADASDKQALFGLLGAAGTAAALSFF